MCHQHAQFWPPDQNTISVFSTIAKNIFSMRAFPSHSFLPPKTQPVGFWWQFGFVFPSFLGFVFLQQLVLARHLSVQVSHTAAWLGKIPRQKTDVHHVRLGWLWVPPSPETGDRSGHLRSCAFPSAIAKTACMELRRTCTSMRHICLAFHIPHVPCPLANRVLQTCGVTTSWAAWSPVGPHMQCTKGVNCSGASPFMGSFASMPAYCLSLAELAALSSIACGHLLAIVLTSNFASDARLINGDNICLLSTDRFRHEPQENTLFSMCCPSCQATKLKPCSASAIVSSLPASLEPCSGENLAIPHGHAHVHSQEGGHTELCHPCFQTVAIEHLNFGPRHAGLWGHRVESSLGSLSIQWLQAQPEEPQRQEREPVAGHWWLNHQCTTRRPPDSQIWHRTFECPRSPWLVVQPHACQDKRLGGFHR